MGILIYATYRLVNQVRFGNHLAIAAMKDAMDQHCRNAVEGHARSTAVLDGRFNDIRQVRRRIEA